MITEEQIKQAAEEEYPVIDTDSFRTAYRQIKRESFTSGARWAIEKDDWISVEEKMPDLNEKFLESEYVLAWEKEHYQPVVCWYNGKEKAWRVAHYKADSLSIEITHWKPLPNPPSINTKVK